MRDRHSMLLEAFTAGALGWALLMCAVALLIRALLQRKKNETR